MPSDVIMSQKHVFSYVAWPNSLLQNNITRQVYTPAVYRFTSQPTQNLSTHLWLYLIDIPKLNPTYFTFQIHLLVLRIDLLFWE